MESFRPVVSNLFKFMGYKEETHLEQARLENSWCHYHLKRRTSENLFVFIWIWFSENTFLCLDRDSLGQTEMRQGILKHSVASE